MSFLRWTAAAAMFTVGALGQVPTYQTRLLGGSSDNGVPGVATSARVFGLGRMTGDPAGNLYFYATNKLEMVDTNGKISVLAGSGDQLYQDGPAATATIPSPNGLLYADNGLFFTQAGPCVIRSVDLLDKLVRAEIGNPGNGCGAGADGPADQVQMQKPAGLALDATGGGYVADQNRVRHLSGDNIVTIAGSVTSGFSGDNGPASQALFNNILALVTDAQGRIYLVDGNNNRIRKIDLNGTVTTIAGNGTSGSTGDGGPATAAQLNNTNIMELALDPTATKLYLTTGNVVRVIDLGTGIISRFAGSGNTGVVYQDGVPALQANFNSLRGIWVNALGQVFLTDANLNRVLRIANGVVTTVAGGGLERGNGGPSQNMWLTPSYALRLPDGSTLVSDFPQQRIFKISKEGVATVFAGLGEAIPQQTATGNGGPATSARLAPNQLARDAQGNIYVADGLSPGGGLPSSLRRITPSGIIDAFGPQSGASGIAIDPAGRFFYITQSSFHRVLRYDSQTDQTITYAGLGAPGTAGTSGFSGDNGQASAATLNTPFNSALDAAGNLYIADTSNNRIRKVDTNGVITTYAGNGTNTFGGDGGQAILAGLPGPRGLAFDAQGNLLISLNGLIMRVDKTTGVINRIAGFITSGFAITGMTPLGGPANNTHFFITNFSIASNGELLLAEQNNQRLTVLTPDSFTTPTISAVLDLADWGASNTLSPGGWVEMYGFKLAPGTRTWDTPDFNGNAGPTSLNGVQVLFNGVPGVVQDVRDYHINAIPKDGLPAGNVTVQVVTAAGQSNIISMLSAARGPGMLASYPFRDQATGNQYVVAIHASDGAYAAPPGLIPGASMRRAKAGDKLILFGIGFGAVTPAVPGGNIAGGTSALPNLVIKIGGKTASFDYAGLAPGYVGLYQFNVTVPAGTGTDGALEMIVNGVPLTQVALVGVQ